MQTASVLSTAPLPGTYWSWRDQAVYYVKIGESHSQRPPLLLVHGFGASTDHWRKTIAGLRSDFEVWAIDLLGFGRSAKPNLTYGGDLWRDQLHDFITTVIGQPVVLVGNSLGGYTCLCVAAQRPESVAGLVLLNSAGPFTEIQVEPPKPDPIREMFGSFMRGLFRQPWAKFILFQYLRQPWVIRQTLQKVYLDQSAITDQLVDEIYRPSCDPGAAEVFASMFSNPQGEKVDVLLKQMQCPLLLLWGEADPWISAQTRSLKFQQHYSQLTEYFLRAGHCPHDEVPDQVNELIRHWMSDLIVEPITQVAQ